MSGLYRVTYNFTIDNDSGGGNNDGVFQIRCIRNSTEISQSVSRVFFDDNGSGADEITATKSFLARLDVDDVINFEFDIINGGSNARNWLDGDNVSFEFIKRS